MEELRREIYQPEILAEGIPFVRFGNSLEHWYGGGIRQLLFRPSLITIKGVNQVTGTDRF